MTAKEQKIQVDLTAQALITALKTLKLVAVTPHPTNPDAEILDSVHYEFRDNKE